MEQTGDGQEGAGVVQGIVAAPASTASAWPSSSTPPITSTESPVEEAEAGAIHLDARAGGDDEPDAGEEHFRVVCV
jgi:hypothetical protein